MNPMFKIGQKVWTLMDNQVVGCIQVKKGTINKISFDGKIYRYCTKNGSYEIEEKYIVAVGEPDAVEMHLLDLWEEMLKDGTDDSEN